VTKKGQTPPLKRKNVDNRVLQANPVSDVVLHELNVLSCQRAPAKVKLILALTVIQHNKKCTTPNYKINLMVRASFTRHRE
jgi:hypothetical protein